MGACFEHKDIFPSIQEIIERLCKQTGEANHEAIVVELLNDPEASAVINRAVQQRPKRNRLWFAGNMVAWLSKGYSSDGNDLSDFYRRFKREKRKGSWPFRLCLGFGDRRTAGWFLAFVHEIKPACIVQRYSAMGMPMALN